MELKDCITKETDSRIVEWLQIKCKICGCTIQDEEHEDIDDDKSANEFAQYLSSKGWRAVYRQPICPSCMNEIKKEI